MRRMIVRLRCSLWPHYTTWGESARDGDSVIEMINLCNLRAPYLVDSILLIESEQFYICAVYTLLCFALILT
jgi:hypothetical protein